MKKRTNTSKQVDMTKHNGFVNGETAIYAMAMKEHHEYCIQKQLDAANDSLKEKYSDIGNEVKEVFNFQLSGSAGVIDCFDLFSYAGKEYRVCPPSKDYWQTLAALMMFIFYFMALMLIFKR